MIVLVRFLACTSPLSHRCPISWPLGKVMMPKPRGIWRDNCHALQSKKEWSHELALEVAIVTWCAPSQYSRSAVSSRHHRISLLLLVGGCEWCVRPKNIRRSRKGGTIQGIGSVYDTRHGEAAGNAIIEQVGDRLDGKEASWREFEREIGRGVVQ